MTTLCEKPRTSTRFSSKVPKPIHHFKAYTMKKRAAKSSFMSSSNSLLFLAFGSRGTISLYVFFPYKLKQTRKTEDKHATEI